jgi:LmbE family N-acetylglucosaminyl deacetylase
MPHESVALLAFGAHPDDIEFACGGVVARETVAGRSARFVVCSRGEAASNGTPAQRTAEAKKAAKILGATIEFLDLGGDAHFEIRATHTIKLAAILRRSQPDIVLAPSLLDNQHPDHAKLGHMVRDATRLARYGGLKELRRWPAHHVHHLLFYAVTAEAEPAGLGKVLIDVSSKEVLDTWKAAMQAHSSQSRTRNYVELQLTRARLNGLRAGIGHAIPLFANDPLLFESLAPLERSARRF